VLHLLDASLEAFLRAEVPLSERQVDVSFEAPDDEWGAQVNRPTVNLFLWEVRSNFEERESGLSLEQQGEGKVFRTPPRPRIDCRYLLTAWTTDVKDEHQLLGSLLTALLTNQEIAPAYLQGDFARVRPIPALKVAQPKAQDDADFWRALGGQIKPGLDIVVTATVDLEPVREAGPPVERYRMDFARGAAAETVELVGGKAEDAPPGTRVTSPRATAVVEEGGTYRVRARAGDRVVVEAATPVVHEVDERGARVADRAKGRTKRGTRSD
jgi:hypothetical protein